MGRAVSIGAGLLDMDSQVTKRAEPFAVALQTLRDGLRQGAFGYDRRLAAAEIAGQLALSPTPVREALARLAGEGLVEERRGQGYFVPRPGATDVADLYRLSLAHVLIALEPRGPRIPAPAAQTADPGEAEGPIALADRLVERVVAEAGSWTLLQSHGRVQARLAPVRRHEPLLIADLEAEARALWAVAGAEPARLSAAVRAFHRRRIRLAARLAGLLESRPGGPAI